METIQRTPIRKAMERLKHLSRNEEMQIRAMARERVHDEATIKESPGEPKQLPESRDWNRDEQRGERKADSSWPPPCGAS